jgi:hypothetical protein
MHTGERLSRSPAAIVSLRPVTLRPCFSASLPSKCRLLNGADRVNDSGINGMIFRTIGECCSNLSSYRVKTKPLSRFRLEYLRSHFNLENHSWRTPATGQLAHSVPSCCHICRPKAASRNNYALTGSTFALREHISLCQRRGTK